MSTEHAHAQHTPGPWKVHPYVAQLGPYNKCRDVGPSGLAVCNVIGEFEHKGEGIGETQEANARLIAAAPELLEALHRVLDMAEIDADDGALALETLRSIRIRARAAIARAEGAA